MQTFFANLLGSNWRTSLFGIVQFVAQLVYNYMQSLPAGASWDWKVFGSSALIGLLSLITKDAVVTGGTVQATTTTATSVVVPTVPPTTPKP